MQQHMYSGQNSCGYAHVTMLLTILSVCDMLATVLSRQESQLDPTWSPYTTHHVHCDAAGLGMRTQQLYSRHITLGHFTERLRLKDLHE